MQVNNCKGLFYRCSIREFFNKRGEYVKNIRFRMLKKLSCNGCDQCEYIKEAANEALNENYNEYFDYEKVVNGDIYKLDLTDISTDPETGIIDDYQVKFVHECGQRKCESCKKAIAGDSEDDQ